MILFGCDFDTDPQYPLAAGVLNDTGIGDEMSRARRLHERAIAAVDEIAGPMRDLLAPGLQRIAHAPLDYAGRSTCSSRFSEVMSSAYPEKAEHAGPPVYAVW